MIIKEWIKDYIVFHEFSKMLVFHKAIVEYMNILFSGIKLNYPVIFIQRYFRPFPFFVLSSIF
jgi:hypothetical protein